MKSMLMFILGGAVASAWWAAGVYEPLLTNNKGILWVIAGAITTVPLILFGIFIVEWISNINHLNWRVDQCLKK